MSQSADTSVLINQYIVAVDDNDTVAKEHARTLGDLIASQALSLVEFIQFLGPHLTSDTDLARAKAVACLADTLDFLSQSPRVTRHDIAVLLDFLISKLDDPPSVENALIALSILVRCVNFRSLECTPKVLDALRKQYDPRKCLARVRFQAFTILNTILTVHLQLITSRPNLANSFVQAFVHVATGEKDPRNLLHSFRINTAINQSFIWDDQSDLHATYIDELFDVCFCYFPISFKPPANDPYKISASQLKRALRSTIASQSRFAKDSFGSLFEKLTSTNPAIRNDAFETILDCVVNYSESSVQEHWPAIWDALKFEILHNEVSVFDAHGNSIYPPGFMDSLDEHDENKSKYFALAILGAIVPKLGNEALELYCTAVCSELNPHVSFEKNKTINSIVILASIASQSIDAYNYIVRFLFSFDVWGKFFGGEGRVHDADSIVLNSEQKTTLVQSLGYILIAYDQLLNSLTKSASTDHNAHFSSSNILTENKDLLIIQLGQLLAISSSSEKLIRRECIRQFVRMISLPAFLSPNDVELVFGYFNNLLLQAIDSSPDWESDVIVGCITDGIARVANGNEQVITDLIFSGLLCRIDQLLLSANMKPLESLLTLLGKICTNNRLLEAATIRLFSRVTEMTKNTECVAKAQKTQSILALVESTILAIQNDSQFLMNSWLDSFLRQIIAIVTNLHQSDECSLPLYETASSLVGLITKFSHRSLHQGLLDEVLTLFCTETAHHSIPCEANVLAKPCALVCFVCLVLANIDKEVSLLPSLGCTQIFNNVLEMAGSATTAYLSAQYYQVLALLVNKFPSPELLVLVEKSQKLAMDTVNLENDEKAVKIFLVYMWLLKGLLVRMDKQALAYLTQLLDAFVSRETSDDSKALLARSLGLLFADIKIFMNLTPKIPNLRLVSQVRPLNSKLLYKQQAFDFVLPKIVEGFYAGTNQAVYLRALSLVAESLPRSVLAARSETILPLVADGIKTDHDQAICRASLTALKIIIEEDSEKVNTISNTLVPALLQLATTSTMGAIRLLALESIHLLFLKCPATTRLKDQCIAQSRSCLDDKRRDVRRACCDLRQYLYEM